MLVEKIEELRSDHPNVETYSIPKLLYLSNVCNKIKRRNYVEEHLLYNRLEYLVNSDEKHFEENKNNYKKLIKDYINE